MQTILGITAEYDPFHSGHSYQLMRAGQQTEPDAVICAMSGDFTQRGEPAVLDKWTRAKVAVEQGVDLVFELPFMYACNRAEQFAAGAVDLMVSAGVTHISFGCESQQPEDLLSLADGQMARADQIREMTRSYMKEGCSRAKASEMASRELFGDQLTDLMLSPNNILALEYLKRIRWWEQEKGVKICSVPVQRRGSGYNGANPSEGYAGGSAIRQMLAAGEDISAYLSYDPKELMWVELPRTRQRLYEFLRSIILRSTEHELAQIYCVGEGMEHRLLKEVRSCESYDEFLSAMVSKRYTAAAIRRIMLYLLMNINEMPVCRPYGRVLAANSKGRRLLRRIEDGGMPQGVSPLTIIAGNNQLQGKDESMRQALKLDERAADMFHLLCGRSVDRCADRRQRPYIARD